MVNDKVWSAPARQLCGCEDPISDIEAKHPISRNRTLVQLSDATLRQTA